MTFKELGLREEVLQGVQALGFENPTPIQTQAIPQLLTGTQDFVGLAQTGTGKTAAFGLPLASLIDFSKSEVQAIILSPTRELGIQIGKDLDNFTKYIRGAKIATVYGGASIENQIKELKRGPQIVVATPGRMVDILNRKVVSLNSVRYAILDEADEMLNMGFKDDLNAILDKTPDSKNVWLFSATMPNEVRKIASNYMSNPFELTVGSKNSGNENIEHQYYVIDEKNRYYALKRVIDFYPEIYGLIFCRTRRETQVIAEKLMRDGYNADSLHGDLSQAQRDTVMNKFRTRTIQILVATDVAARGIDVDDITNVINYNLPDEIEVYTHRSGRTGRAGKTGISIVFVTPKEVSKIRQIEKMIKRNFEKTLVPEGRQICEKQLFHLIEGIKSTQVDTDEIEAYIPSIMEQLQDLSKEELIVKFVAAEFNRFLSYYKNSRDINISDRGVQSSQSGGRDDGMDRLFINIGAKDGYNKGSFINMICDQADISGKSIGRIDIMDSFSFFQLEREVIEKVIKKFSGADVDGRTIRIEVAGPRKGGGDNDRDRDRGGFKKGGFSRDSGSGSRRGGGFSSHSKSGNKGRNSYSKSSGGGHRKKY